MENQLLSGKCKKNRVEVNVFVHINRTFLIPAMHISTGSHFVSVFEYFANESTVNRPPITQWLSHRLMDW